MLDRVQDVKGKEMKGRTEMQNKCPCQAWTLDATRDKC